MSILHPQVALTAQYVLARYLPDRYRWSEGHTICCPGIRDGLNRPDKESADT